MERRTFLLAISASSLIGSSRLRATPFGADAQLDDIRNNWKELLAPHPAITLSTAPIKKSNDEWRKSLNRLQFSVLRDEATENPGGSPLNHEKRPGAYVCAGCLLPLFTSRMKYESGTGWPSFFTSIPGHLSTKADFKLPGEPRTEYHCVRCGGHQGHLFPDGPKPTFERWCNNGAALLFLPV